MRSAFTCSLVGLYLLLSCALPETATSQVEDLIGSLTMEQLDQVAQLLDEASGAESDADWARAVEIYRAIHSILPAVEYQWAEALNLERAGQTHEAIARYEQIATSGIASLAEAASARLSALRSPEPEPTPLGRLVVMTEPLGATVQVEDTATHSSVGSGVVSTEDGFTFDVPPGTYRLSVELAGFAPSTRVVPVEAGAELRVVALLDNHVESPRASPPPPPARRNLTWTFVLGGTSLTSLGVGITLGVLANRREAEALEYDVSAPGHTRRDQQAISDQADTFATWANAAFVSAGVFAAGAIVAFFLSAPDEDASTESMSVAPLLTRDALGGVVRWRF